MSLVNIERISKALKRSLPEASPQTIARTIGGMRAKENHDPKQRELGIIRQPDWGSSNLNP